MTYACARHIRVRVCSRAQAVFEGEVDASTVKHRLDVLNELRLPVYITEFAISGLDPAKHAYELEKFLRIAFSHDAVAGIMLGDLWDRSAGGHGSVQSSSGLYAANKQPKPAAARLDHLWKEVRGVCGMGMSTRTRTCTRTCASSTGSGRCTIES